MLVNTKDLNNVIKNINTIAKTTIKNNLTNVIHLKIDSDVLTLERTNGFSLHQGKVFVRDSYNTKIDVLLDSIEQIKTKEELTELNYYETTKETAILKIGNTVYHVKTNGEYLNTNQVYPNTSDYNFVSVNPSYLINALKSTKADNYKQVLIGINKASDIAPIYVVCDYTDIKNIVLPKRKCN